jgi:hypothetical protein
VAHTFLYEPYEELNIPFDLACVDKKVEFVQCTFLSLLSNCGMLIIPYLSEGLNLA